MKTVAIYNLKGGVGKTTTAVNLSYLAAASGQRTLLWDVDPQAASTFAFRIRPHVPEFEKGRLENGRAFSAAIKQTDYDNLYLLPADCAYHKFDRLLSSAGNADRLLRPLLATIDHDVDIVFLDCPAGFSRLTQAILTVADVILAPAIPTVLSLRTLAQLVQQAERSGSTSTLVAVFNMVDRRKTLHRLACELATEHPELFLSAGIPNASAVEQMAARRMPTVAFAAHEPAAIAFAAVWGQLRMRLRRQANSANQGQWPGQLKAIESLIARLESTAQPEPVTPRDAGPVVASPPHAQAHPDVVHSFDTAQGDLKRRGQALELRERHGGEFFVVARSEGASGAERAEARIDRSWTVQILAGDMSPLEALERRIGRPQPRAIEHVRAAAAGQRLRRVDTYRSADAAAEAASPCAALPAHPQAAGF